MVDGNILYRDVLKQLHNILHDSNQKVNHKFNNLSRLALTSLQAESCAIYIRRAGDVLELFGDAHHGNIPRSLEKYIMIGDGIIGTLAQKKVTRIISNCHHHDAYKKHDILGNNKVTQLIISPIIPGGRLIGVIILGFDVNKQLLLTDSNYVSMIASILSDARFEHSLLSLHETTPSYGINNKPLHIDAIGASQGLCLGMAVIFNRDIGDYAAYSDNPENEKERLLKAFKQLNASYENMLNQTKEHDIKDIIEALSFISQDSSWHKKMYNAVETGISAEAAVQAVLDDIRTNMEDINDAYLRNRLLDIEDLATQLLRLLTGHANNTERHYLHDNSIVIARNLSLHDLLSLNLDKISGIILEEGGHNSHISIVARTMEIPLLVQATFILARVAPRDLIAIDGDNGVCYIRPGEEFRETFRQNKVIYDTTKHQYSTEIHKKTITQDNVTINLYMNAALLMDFDRFSKYGAAGVGLYRTEMTFLNRDSMPTLNDQYRIYTNIIKKMQGKPITIRLLDIGADKTLPYFPHKIDRNPNLGWRSMRILMDVPGIIKSQCHAIIKAAHDTNSTISILFPMVATADEFFYAYNICQFYIKKYALPHGTIRIGVMFEVPSLLFAMDKILPYCDFMSIGTNDLAQFFYACERDNPTLLSKYSLLDKSFLSMIKQAVDHGKAYNVNVTLCGESAQQDIMCLAYMGLGIHDFSVNGAAIGPIRRMIRATNLGHIRHYMAHAMTHSQNFTLDNDLVLYMQDYNYTPL